jgi:hypothetical protein
VRNDSGGQRARRCFFCKSHCHVKKQCGKFLERKNKKKQEGEKQKNSGEARPIGGVGENLFFVGNEDTGNGWMLKTTVGHHMSSQRELLEN